MGKTSQAHSRGHLATLGSEPGLQEVYCKLLSLLPFPHILPAPLPPFPLISQVCTISPQPNPQLEKRPAKAAFAAVPLTLPSYPQIFGTLIPRFLISQATLSLWVLFFLSLIKFWLFFFCNHVSDLFNWGSVLFHLPPLNESQEMGE